MKYIGIKVKGMDYWLWFEISKTTVEGGVFSGKQGWGKGGVLTEITVNENLIEGRVESNVPQYGG